MPREMVKGRGPGDGYDVKVGWGPDRYVQLGVETNDDRPLLRMLCESNVALLGTIVKHVVDNHGPVDSGKTGRPWSDDAVVGEALLSLLSGSGPAAEFEIDGPPVASFTWRGVWADLDREGCNRLIRLLRKARDSAYGRDE